MFMVIFYGLHGFFMAGIISEGSRTLHYNSRIHAINTGNA
jgi:hypothetical protein